jgi:hypothetical protein
VTIKSSFFVMATPLAAPIAYYDFFFLRPPFGPARTPSNEMLLSGGLLSCENADALQQEKEWPPW